MFSSINVKDLVRNEDDQIRYLTANLCRTYRIQSFEDMVQEVYLWIIDKDILGQYDPNYQGKQVKLSTFLYTVIKNLIRGKKSDNETQIYQNRFRPPIRKYKSGGVQLSEVELALRYNDMAIEYENIIEHNKVSDDLEGLGADLDDFEKYLASDNQSYALSRRKDKDVPTEGINLVQAFRLLREGYSSRDISKKFGFSDMFASNLKREIAIALQAYGLGPKESPVKYLYHKLDMELKKAHSPRGKLSALYRFTKNFDRF